MCFWVFSAKSQTTIQSFPCGNSSSTPVGLNDLPENYTPICSDPNVIKYIRVTVHFLLPEKIIDLQTYDCLNPSTIIKFKGPGNFTEFSDGYGATNYNGYQRAEEIINKANAELDQNASQNRQASNPNIQNPPLNITYPAVPPTVPIRYVLNGVYFHRDNNAYNLIDAPNAIYQKYAIDKQNSLNIFDTPKGQWSGVANALGGSAKYVFLNDYLTYISCKGWSTAYVGSLINHEIGHTVGLHHTWNEFDKCDDTPMGFIYDRWFYNSNTFMYECHLNEHANCWGYNNGPAICPGSTKGLPCDDWIKVSNNAMDYNENAPHAFTVCQVNSIEADIKGAGNKFVHSCNGCMPSISFFETKEIINCIYPTALPLSPIILDGQASFNENKWLIDICEVDPANTTVCLSNNINSGWHSGQIGKLDLRTLYTFSIGKTYKVKLIVDNTNCPLSSEFTKTITFKPCTGDPNGINGFDFQATNPFGSEVHVFYSIENQGQLIFKLINSMTGASSTLMSENNIQPGDYELSSNVSFLSSGNYVLQAIFNGQVVNKTIIKP